MEVALYFLKRGELVKLVNTQPFQGCIQGFKSPIRHHTNLSLPKINFINTQVVIKWGKLSNGSRKLW